MQCAACGRQVTRHRTLPWARRWCSTACRRRMIGELRDLSLTVARCSAAIEMPDVIAQRDHLIERFVQAAIPQRPVSPPNPRFTEPEDVNELPLYWS